MRNVPGLETVYLDYKGKGVDFYYVYKSLAHPEKDGFVQPVTLEERLSHIEAAKKQLGTAIPWLADSMSNDLKHAFGDRNNSEFVISPEGKVIVARSWSDPSLLRSDLEKWVGESESKTEVSDLDLRIARAIPEKPDKIATGVVPRVERPSGMVALVSRNTSESGKKEAPPSSPLYAKLRAEASSAGLRPGRSGTLYLGFHLDPIYAVHWNNEAPPLSLSVEAPEGVLLAEDKGKADLPEGTPADSDPREFLLDFEVQEQADLSRPLKLTVKYFACDDADRWCKAVTQTYEILLKPDPDGGRVNSGGSRMRSGGGAGKGGRGGGPGMPDAAEMIERMDQDEDGKVSKKEARGRLQMQFDRFDRNGDGDLDESELKEMQALRRSP